MSVYTPTTEEIRAKYTMPECCEVCQIEAAEFDRWFAQKLKEERKRILKKVKNLSYIDRMGYRRLDANWFEVKTAIKGEEQ